MERFLENLQRQAEENPVLALGVAAGLLTSISQLISSAAKAKNANANVKNSRAWEREVDRRVRKAIFKDK
jgi:hypothetical protein